MNTYQDQLERGADASAEVSVEATEAGSGSPSTPVAAKEPRKITVKSLMREAAQVAASQGRDLEAFMNVAYKAFLEANPHVREQLADAQVLAELKAMRKLGKVGLA